MGIAEAAIAAAGKTLALADMDHIGDQGLVVLIQDLGADRHFQDDIIATGASAVLAHAVVAACRLEMLLIAIVDQGVEALDTFHPDVTATAAITAVGAAEFDVFFTPEADAAGAADA